MNILDNFENILFEKYLNTKLISLIKKDFNPNGYKYFRTYNGIKNWGKENSQYFKKIRELQSDLLATEKQIDEIQLFDYYAGYGSGKINKFLRGNPQFLINEEYFKKKSISLENYINKFHLTENLVSVRLMPSEFIDKNYKKGNAFIEKGFLSTSLNLGYRLDYQSSKVKLKSTAFLIIKIPKGTRAVYTEEVQAENKQRKEYELIIQRNQKITVEYHKKIFTNRIIVLAIEKRRKHNNTYK